MGKKHVWENHPTNSSSVVWFNFPCLVREIFESWRIAKISVIICDTRHDFCLNPKKSADAKQKSPLAKQPSQEPRNCGPGTTSVQNNEQNPEQNPHPGT
jgi:hypothetical protein